ncbi:E3 ubiquitin-protein ligase PPP1R11 isoform X2 [Taeniopygia guttata]|uniref:E3 ubiquitin-protein ligase PPP1R11 isoform X2 n=1 Tax=Taeniopygia guttata TaxID=59729 RepID=UPI003BB87EDB
MAETAESGGCGTATVTESGTAEPENRSLTLKLRKRKPDKKVEWSSDTVDNEHLGRRSSKCCCIYERPRPFGESSPTPTPILGGLWGGSAPKFRGFRAEISRVFAPKIPGLRSQNLGVLGLKSQNFRAEIWEF